MRRLALVALGLAPLAGCSLQLAQDNGAPVVYTAPVEPIDATPTLGMTGLETPYLPDTYPPIANIILDQNELARWWVAFQDQALNETIVLAVANSVTLATTQDESLKQEELRRIQKDAAIAYFDMVLANALVSLAEQQSVAANGLNNSVQERFASGDVGRADVLLSEASLRKAEHGLAETSEMWAASDAAYRNVVGYQRDPNSLLVRQKTDFHRPLVIDLGSPSSLPERRKDLLIKAVSGGSRANNSSYQESLDRVYSHVSRTIQSILPIQEQINQLEQQEKTLSSSYDLYRDQYLYGRASLTDVLVVQEQWFETQIAHLSALHRRSTNFVDLYFAAGGGTLSPSSPRVIPFASSVLESDLGGDARQLQLSPPSNAFAQECVDLNIPHTDFASDSYIKISLLPPETSTCSSPR